MLKFSFISLGCPRALVDSEKMIGNLVKAGFVICEDYRMADAIIINTCAFLQSARDESLEFIRKALQLKKNGAVKKVAIVGCLVEFLKHLKMDCLKWSENYEIIDNIDGFLSLAFRDKIATFCEKLLKGKAGDKVYFISPRKYGLPVKTCGGMPRLAADTERIRLTPSHYSYLKISEGCNCRCSFCLIPKIKGKLVSKPLEVVIKEAKEMVENGAVELCLVAQDSAAYGVDLYGKPHLDKLLQKLAKINGVQWIRILYANPEYITDELINTIADEGKVVKYLDIPIQHINSAILKRMHRKYNKLQIYELIDKLRHKIAGLFLRTSIIVGFPGENDEHFEELLRFVNDIKFERLGVFMYSREPYTPAFSFEEQVDEKVKLERFSTIMKAQRNIAYEFNRNMCGKLIPVIVDRKNQKGKFQYEGRSYGDAPEVDGKVYFNGPDWVVGKVYNNVKVTGVKGYDLIVSLV